MGLSVAQRVLRRLDLSAVPVRTAVLMGDLSLTRRQLWAALLRLEKAGRLARDTRPVEVAAAPCPCCGRALPARNANRNRESFWRLTGERAK